MDAHGCHKFNNSDLAHGPRDTTAHFPVFFLTVSRAANKPSTGAWNAKLPSMNVVNAVGDSPNLQRLNVLVPLWWEKHSMCCSFTVATASEDLHWSSTRPSLTYAVAQARCQCGDGDAGEGDAARQDHMSAHDLTSSANASEF